MYAFGQGVAQDYVAAHVWANLAAAQGDEDARELREQVAAAQQSRARMEPTVAAAMPGIVEDAVSSPRHVRPRRERKRPQGVDSLPSAGQVPSDGELWQYEFDTTSYSMNVLIPLQYQLL